MTTFTTEDRVQAEKEPIPFGGLADLSKKDEEIWHFSMDVTNSETKIEIKKTWEF